MREDFFLFYMSTHIHFHFFLLLPLFKLLKVSGGVFFCQYVLCSPLLHLCPSPSSFPFLLFSHTRVDIIIFLSLSMRCVLLLLPRLKNLGCGNFSLPFYSTGFFQSGSQVTGTSMKQPTRWRTLKKPPQKNTNRGWKEERDKHGFRTAKCRKVKLVFLTFFGCMYG